MALTATPPPITKNGGGGGGGGGGVDYQSVTGEASTNGLLTQQAFSMRVISLRVSHQYKLSIEIIEIPDTLSASVGAGCNTIVLMLAAMVRFVRICLVDQNARLIHMVGALLF